ncbi:MAG: kinesin motor protein cin8 [Caeruleum heppii]|nr:MAG: kinesin motor protein cin8 [Caeruleum heppii]
MAGLPRPATGQPTKRQTGSMRPPLARPSSARTRSNAQPLSGSGRLLSTTSSPAASVTSAPPSASAARSPSYQSTTVKRRVRELNDEETNIHVVVRCRGRNDREVRENSGVVLSTDGVKGNSVELAMGPSALSNKTYHFDKVFSPAADQNMIFDEVVTPILNEMLSGYNCTIFAYGQTGTGKTYTMSGDMSDTLGLVSDAAGIIPRVLHSLFKKLEGEETESSVKCSFIELYNEELRDLLSADDSTKLKIYEETSKKGHGATLVQGMEESHISSATDGVKLLGLGSHKRQVAATKCNDLSSRSHTVFTITAYIKRAGDNGEDYVSAGKLNLVDLAGSENIQRSGAENKRAAEAGVINKSLLTLGRVINALVDKGSHIPYRESKLTRLLQDSLGGRTKTCIIATVSPAKSNLEETVSTLDYAFRAKNIRNKPQVNQMVSKKTLLREFTTEIEKLKSELIATRQRNGVYLTAETFEEMTKVSESRKILSEELTDRLALMETSLRNKVEDLYALTANFSTLKRDHDGTKAVLDETKGLLEKTEFVLQNTRETLAEETTMRKAHQTTEAELNVVGGQLLATLGTVVTDVAGLHSKIQRKTDLQAQNRDTWTAAQIQVSTVTQLVEGKVAELQAQQRRQTTDLAARMHDFVYVETQKLASTQKILDQRVQSFETSKDEICKGTLRSRDGMNDILEEIKVLREDVKQRVGEGLNGLSAAAARISAEVINELGSFHDQLHTSYSTLGRDFKNIFEELLKQWSAQRAQVEGLKRELTDASETAMAANAAATRQLDEYVSRERQQSAIDRQDLLRQIEGLVNASGASQNARLEAKVGAIRGDMETSRMTFEAARTQYGEGMDLWSERERSLVEEIVRSRDNLKSKLKKDWMEANEHNSAIQTTTKSVHEETIRIVDAQMRDISLQMQALDDFVSRARSQNGHHHDTHAQSLEALAGGVKDAYASFGGHFDSSHESIQGLRNDMSGMVSAMDETIAPLELALSQPLSHLRCSLTDASLDEDVATGDTPQKTQYEYPRLLPRTEDPETLLRGLKRPADECVEVADGAPSKPTSSVFADADDEVALVRPVEEDRPARALFGLKEMDVNVSAGYLSGSDSTSSIAAGPDMPPPAKKQHLTDSRLPQKLGVKASMIKLEGRENSVMPAFGSSTNRRLRSSD